MTFFKTMNTIRQGKRKYNPYALNTGLLANKANVVPTTVYHQNILCPEEKLVEELNVLMCFPLFSGLKYKINAKNLFVHLDPGPRQTVFLEHLGEGLQYLQKKKKKRKHYGFFFHFYTMFITRYTSRHISGHFLHKYISHPIYLCILTFMRVIIVN